MLYYLINRYKLNRRIILKLSLEVLLGVPCSLTKDIEHFSFFKKEMVVVNIPCTVDICRADVARARPQEHQNLYHQNVNNTINTLYISTPW